MFLVINKPRQSVKHAKYFATSSDRINITISYCRPNYSGKKERITKNPQIRTIDDQITIFIQRSRYFCHRRMNFSVLLGFRGC